MASSTAVSSSSHSDDSLPVNIVGAGLTGSMAALLLAQKGEKIRLIESRGDFRKTEQSTQFDALTGRLTNTTKRSINLALSHRGVSALKAAGPEIFERLRPHLIPMRGRFVHPATGGINFQPYGTGDQAIYSVSRNGLNALLLDELDRMPNVESLYNTKVDSITKEATVISANGEKFPGKYLLGTDGAFSRIRTSMGRLMRQNVNFQYIDHGYKEIQIPPQNGNFAFPDWQGLHIWPRTRFMLIALPNPDFSFTATLFAPFDGPDGLETLEKQGDQEILAYFQQYFPDIIPLVPDLIEEFRSSPSSALVTVRCSPWNFQDKILLLGDAAHAVVPFYGQGMNSGFEDCLVLKEYYDQYDGDYHQFIPKFSSTRGPDGYAIADLSMENYREMSELTDNYMFIMKKRIESVIHWFFPTRWIPKYSMVAFTRIPYHQAKKRSEQQEKILNLLLGGVSIGFLTLSIWGIGKLESKFQFTSMIPSVSSSSSSSSSSSENLLSQWAGMAKKLWK